MRPRLKSDVVTSALPNDETVIATADKSTAVILNAMGTVVAELCDGTRTIADIAAFICDHVAGAAPSTVAGDVESIIAELVAAGLVETDEAP